MDWGTLGSALWTLLGCLIPTVIVVVMLVTIIRRGRAIGRLVREGVDGEATVIKKFRTSRRGSSGVPYLRYELHDPFGQAFQRKITVTEAEYTRYEVGDTIEVTYCPDDYSVNAARSMVEKARAAVSERSTPEDRM